MSTFLNVIFGVAALSVVVLLPRKLAGGRRLFLLRVLFPSWRFFESIGVVSKLYVRVVDGEGGYQNWVPALKAPRVSWPNLFFNPRGNLYFAKQSAVEHLVSEIEDGQESGSPIENSLAYALVREIACDSVRSGVASDCRSLNVPNGFQFKVALLDESGVEEDLMISPTLGVGGSS
ncbi:hypothetical protein EBZ37_14580 [bacterium]|nr:hypothetical protein [bacterium]